MVQPTSCRAASRTPDAQTWTLDCSRHVINNDRSYVDGRSTVLLAPVELDAATAPALARSVRQAYDDGAPSVTLDFKHTTFCDSSGIKLLVNARKQATALGRDLVVRDPPRMLCRMGEALGIAGLLGIPAV